MTLDEMKKIAANRTEGQWTSEDAGFVRIDHALGISSMACMPHDARFIAMAATNWDKIIEVIECAKYHGVDDVCLALKALEGE